jgi:hypothetical protein
MSVSAWVETQLAIGGALKLARGDARGLGFFDTSLDGFWRSFRAALICYPAYLALLAMRMPSPPWESAGIGRIILVESIAFVISWTAFPLLMLSLSRGLGRENRFLAFMVAYNWCQVPQTVLFLIIGLDMATGLLPGGAGDAVGLAAALAVMVYEWYIARLALAIPAIQAVLVVLLDLVLGTALSRVAESLYSVSS